LQPAAPLIFSMSDASEHDRWMGEAIAEAEAARAADEVPIGCVIVHEPTGRIIGRGHNLRETQHDPTAHAEMIAMRQASNELQSWRLLDCTLYVTLEPCPMCAGAIVQGRVPKLVYGCGDPKAGAVRTLYRICDDARLNHIVEIIEGVRAEECARLLSDFFKAQRAVGKK
jgi:tRNA(adenine34) deaminase